MEYFSEKARRIKSRFSTYPKINNKKRRRDDDYTISLISVFSVCVEVNWLSPSDPKSVSKSSGLRLGADDFSVYSFPSAWGCQGNAQYSSRVNQSRCNILGIYSPNFKILLARNFNPTSERVQSFSFFVSAVAVASPNFGFGFSVLGFRFWDFQTIGEVKSCAWIIVRY